MLVGYARVSSAEQNVSLQIDALEKIGCDKIFKDKMSGAKAKRPGLQEALAFLREGDTLVVWRLDRLGRSLKNLIDTVGRLEERKIGFRSLQESIDTTTTSGRLIFHIFGALAEFERNLIRDRTTAGLKSARSRGRTGGRRRKLDKKKTELLYRLYDEKQHTTKEICQMFSIAKPTLYAYLARRDPQPPNAPSHNV